MFIESRNLRPHVRPPEARWPGLCATGLGRHEGGHASSRDEGYTETRERLRMVPLPRAVRPPVCGNVASKPEAREARQSEAHSAREGIDEGDGSGDGR